MIKSMTGFGRYEAQEGTRKFTVEMKSVNHRYMEANIKMPKRFNIYEASIRTLLKNYIQRGKVDVFITYEDTGECVTNVKYNKELAAQYLGYLKQMAEDFGLEEDVRVSTLSRFPDVLVEDEASEDEEELWKLLETAITKASEAFVETRIKEGENLKNDLLIKLDGMLEHVDYIEKRSPELLKEYTEKITAKVQEMLQDAHIDEGRIATEVTLFADKVCVDEEIVRLRSHIEATRNVLNEGGSVGRKLDFIAQEMNREANTILSKANDLNTSDHAIELKTDIEKVREQIQNIE